MAVGTTTPPRSLRRGRIFGRGFLRRRRQSPLQLRMMYALAFFSRQVSVNLSAPPLRHLLAFSGLPDDRGPVGG